MSRSEATRYDGQTQGCPAVAHAHRTDDRGQPHLARPVARAFQIAPPGVARPPRPTSNPLVNGKESVPAQQTPARRSGPCRARPGDWYALLHQQRTGNLSEVCLMLYETHGGTFLHRAGSPSGSLMRDDFAADEPRPRDRQRP